MIVKFAFMADRFSTPNTYDQCYKPIPEEPGVYLICDRRVNYDAEKENRITQEIVYVGSAINLKKRTDGHELARFLRSTGADVTFWFYECEDYKQFEKYLIRFINPKYNKQHKILRHG